MKRCRWPHGTATQRRLHGGEDHRMMHVVRREGMHGTIQDPTMHAARDTVTPLRNTIMKHVEALHSHDTSPSSSTPPLRKRPGTIKAHEPRLLVRRDGRSEAPTKGVQEGGETNGTGERMRWSARHCYYEALWVASRHSQAPPAPWDLARAWKRTFSLLKQKKQIS